MCHLTYSYIFTPQPPLLLAEWGFNPVREPDDNGNIIHNIWLSSSGGLFCLRLVEIIDERSLPASIAQRDLPLSPEFAEAELLPPQEIKPRFYLEGFLIQDQEASKEHLSRLQLPAPTFFEPSNSRLARSFLYRKTSPYWALLVRPVTPGSPPPAAARAMENNLSWGGQRVSWIQLETTCWDFLVVS